MIDRLSYLELKKDIVFGEKTIRTAGKDLPIETRTLLSYIESGDQKDIPWSDFVCGMLLHIAIHGHDAVYESFLRETIFEPHILALHYAKEKSDDLFLEAAMLLSAEPLVVVHHAQGLLRKARGGDDSVIQKAMQELDGVLDQVAYAPAYALYGELFLALGDELKAHQYFKHALLASESTELQDKMRERIEETSTGATVALAVNALQKGRTEESLKLLSNRLKDDDAGILHYWQGVTLQGLGRLQESVHALECAWEKRPEDLFIPNDLAISLYMLGEHREAIKVLKQVMSSKDPRILCNLMILSEPDDKDFSDELYRDLKKIEAEGKLHDASILDAVKEYGDRYSKIND